MERTPSETWTKIFAHACTDSGETGRQLSLVSKFTRAASAPVKYQSIAAHGARQITAFHQLLLQTPSHLRRIKYLLLSIGRTTSQEELDQISEVGPGVLTAVADSIEILYLNVPQDFNLWNFAIPFPRLVELASHSFPPPRRSSSASIEPNVAPFPQLHRCYFMCTGPLGISEKRLGDIYITAPAITHLRFATLQLESCFASDLTATLSDTIQLVYVKPGAPPMYGGRRKTSYQYLTSGLEELNRTDSRLVLLPAYLVDDPERPITTGEWEERINGGDGCWSLRERILADNNIPASGFSSSEEQNGEMSSTAV
ncbi:hypothetical protein FIBSPDRAFT_867969 [Athelia psychrophila]|uniref:F-box domain-containing protein n=1 Tax=Athelia psychrophila TaxID=1759441 RepID=A0A166DL88_9AGAM|nr:hypothetical protein FIBSPDRAFT_867969 [Fibularhizoctonia sp. CBS 109695]